MIVHCEMLRLVWGPKNGVAREERFDITAASEVMAILALASDYADLRHRLGEIVVAESRSDTRSKPMTLVLLAPWRSYSERLSCLI